MFDFCLKFFNFLCPIFMICLIFSGQRWVWDVAFSADSQYMFTASSDGVAKLWSIPDAEVKRTYKENGHTKAVTCLAFRDGQVG